jgi:hypothetical protein
VRALDVNRRDVAKIALGDLRHRHTASDDDYECCKHKLLHNKSLLTKSFNFGSVCIPHGFGHPQTTKLVFKVVNYAAFCASYKQLRNRCESQRSDFVDSFSSL